MGYENATPVQQQVMVPILEGKDIIAAAQTGTGKTAAFGADFGADLGVASTNDTWKIFLNSSVFLNVTTRL